MEAINDFPSPIWASVRTMARLLDIAPSTLRVYCADGRLPSGQKRWGIRRYHVARTLAAFEGKASPDEMQLPIPANDNIDPIMAGIKAHGSQAHSRRPP